MTLDMSERAEMLCNPMYAHSNFTKVATWQTPTIKIGRIEYGLSRCPFCGGNHLSLQEVENTSPQVGLNLSRHTVLCVCGATGPFVDKIDRGEAAIQAWNTRAPTLP